jgi:hypothetical protein
MRFQAVGCDPSPEVGVATLGKDWMGYGDPVAMFVGPKAADPEEESLGGIPSEAEHDAEHVVELLKAAPRQCAEHKKLQLRRHLRAPRISSMCRFCQSTQWPY